MAGIIRRIVFAPGLPKPAAPYSPAVIVDKTMYVSGQLGVDASGEIVSGGLEAEAEQALKNLQTLLQSVGSDLGNVVKVSVRCDLDLKYSNCRLALCTVSRSPTPSTRNVLTGFITS